MSENTTNWGPMDADKREAINRALLPEDGEGKSGEEKGEEKPLVPKAVSASVAGIWVGMVSLILFLRLFAVSDWKWTVAAELVDSFNFDDAISIFMGTLFERPHITAAFVALMLPLGIFRDYWLARAHALKTRANNWFVIAGLIATLYVLVRSFGMWWALIVAVTLTLLLVTVSILWTKGRARMTLSKVGRHVGALLVAFLVYLSVAVDTPWMSKERIETETSVYYGYVLEAEPGFLKVLTMEREVLLLPDADVLSRTIEE